MITGDKESIRRDRNELERVLRDAGVQFKGKACTCPFHEDRHPSGSVYQAEDGAWRFKCHVPACGFCGDVFDVLEKLTGRSVEDQLRDLKRDERPERKPEKKVRVFASVEELQASVVELKSTYLYQHPQTRAVEMIVLRCEDSTGRKSFLQCRPQGDGFVMMSPPKPWPLYNRTRVAAATTVIVVEGEKCVHALQEIGIVATTSPGGAGKAQYADWTPLAGKTVYLWPDNDPEDPKTGKRTGIEHMREVAVHLQALDPAPKVYWIDPDTLSLPPKGDAVDYIAEYGADAVQPILGLAELLDGAQDLSELIEDTLSGKRRAVPWPWPMLSRLTKSLLPGTITAVCGDPGSTKSFAVLEAGWFWHANGEKVAIYELEEDRAYHLQRALAQLDDNADLTDADWMVKNADVTREALSRHREFLSSFARCITAAPDAPPKLSDLTQWVRQKCQTGHRIIVIDPITVAATSEKPWIDDLSFLMDVKAIIRQYGASLILVTHPRKGRNGRTGLDDLAGGAAYSRFSQTVVWIERHDEPKDVRMRGEHGFFVAKVNRSFWMRKTRNGRGAGLELGYIFDGRSLRFSEQGIVVGDADHEEIPV